MMSGLIFSLRRFVVVLLVFAVIGVFCSPVPAMGQAKQQEEVVLFVCLTLGNPFYTEMLTGLNEELSATPSVHLEARNGRSPTDATGQREIIESFLARHSAKGNFRLKGVILVPANSGLIIANVVRELNDARVPVVNLDIAIDADALTQAGAHVDAFIGSNNVDGGRAAADALMRFLPKGGKVLLLLGGLGEATTRDRRNGFVTRLGELKDQHGYQTSLIERTADWANGNAFTQTDSILSSGTGLDGIFAENDLMALGASRAVGSHMLPAKPIIIGYDATPDARTAIQNGQLNASISQNPAEMGRKGIAALKILWSGGKILNVREYTAVQTIAKTQP